MGGIFLQASDIISLLGGVALFLFGMSLMGDGLKRVAGSKMELILYRLSGTPLRGVLLGTAVTAVIQSSSATSAMVVGFVNSGMMKLSQAVSVIHGALIGTSITGWIVSLSSLEGNGWVSLLSTSTLAAIVSIVGIIMRMFSKKQRTRHAGDILLGFAVLMFGMHSMSGAVSPLRESPQFLKMLTAFAHPVLGILFGAAFTTILQSASAAVGILQALSMTGAVTFSVAWPIILGIAIGSSVPVLLSALGAKVNGRRAAFSYLMIEILGVLIIGLIYYILDAALHFDLDNHIMSTVSIAALNTIFRVATAVVLVPLQKPMIRLISSLLRESEKERAVAGDLDRLDERFLRYPALAVEQSRLTVNSMAKTARDNLLRALDLMEHYSDEGMEQVEQTEDLVDRYEDKLGTYLVKLNTQELDVRQNQNVSKYLHTLSDFERISDHAMNIAEVAQEIDEKKVSFSEHGDKELRTLGAALGEILNTAITAFIEDDIDTAYKVEPLEEWIDVLCDEMKSRHVTRLKDGTCSLSQGFVFNDILTNFERVADHCSNIAIAIIELEANEFDAHGYLLDLKELRSHGFDELYQQYSRKYSI
ncbi:MAG: Na/Pi cotransporter family protein [Oscillospiraceae bacterium]|nr:Na/Pi cotransporter family protein [Oscillospiraceae bacterium]